MSQEASISSSLTSRWQPHTDVISSELSEKKSHPPPRDTNVIGQHGATGGHHAQEAVAHRLLTQESKSKMANLKGDKIYALMGTEKSKENYYPCLTDYLAERFYFIFMLF